MTATTAVTGSSSSRVKLGSRSFRLDRRSNFQAAIAASHRTGYLKPPTARWDMLNEAVATIECEAREPSVAAKTVRSIIRRNAELVAHIGVREIEIISISPAD